jgi:Cu-Zn family superoxide dismutase
VYNGKPLVSVILLLAAGAITVAAPAADLKVTMYKVTANRVGESMGTIEFRDSSDFGVLIIPKLHGLTPGLHGFHMHQNPACEPQVKDGKPVAGLAAGGHYDPANTGRHEGPVGNGHLGDLPALLADPEGNTPMAMFAPRLQVPDLVGRSVVVHADGDNYSDQPQPLGGGGARVACGVVSVESED